MPSVSRIGSRTPAHLNQGFVALALMIRPLLVKLNLAAFGGIDAGPRAYYELTVLCLLETKSDIQCAPFNLQ